VLTKWHRELNIFYQIKSGIILEGNINDVYIFPEQPGPQGATVPLTQYLYYFLKARQYETVVKYDMLHGFTEAYQHDGDENLKAFAALVGKNEGAVKKKNDTAFIEASLRAANDSAPELISNALAQTGSPVAIIMDLASRYVSQPDALQMDEVYAFSRLQNGIASGKSAKAKSGGLLRNLVLLICGKQNDLPAWLFLNNPTLKTITIGKPTPEERGAFFANGGLRGFLAKDVYETEYSQLTEEDADRLIQRFVSRTEGFTNFEMNNLRNLSKNQRVHIKDLCSVVDLYSYGIKDNPWENPQLFKKLFDTENAIRRRVKGQDAAVRQTMDVIKRSVVGLSGAQHSSHTKPKGVLFFAGPTGTGKTELAKTLAELIFGDERACIRFDMSEYSQSHSDQKLLGAPPGYVGYEAGGQLTNAVRENPFCILLFDEIEKAAPSIMDKFLQILEDGRMTDGQGNTVYFSESVIIFTSNLGITVNDGFGQRTENVTQEMPYEEVRTRVRSAIEDYFKRELGRPEILNRIGENIVVFDYIREPVAKEILDLRLGQFSDLLRQEKNINLVWSQEAYQILYDKALQNLANGGRGIGNIVEALWINPISRELFAAGNPRDRVIRVVKLNAETSPAEVSLEVREA